MGTPIFSLKLVLNNSVQYDADRFDLDVTVTDVFPNYSAADIQVGDLLFLDFTQAMGYEGQVFRFKVDEILSVSGFDATLRAKFDESGDVADPINALGYPSFISRTTTLQHIAAFNLYDLYGLPPYLITYALNTEMKTKVDGLGGGGGASTKTMQNLSGTTIPNRAAVAKMPNGGITIADSDGTNQQVVIGIAMASIANAAVGPVLTIGPNADGAITGLGFNVSDSIYISETNGYTNDPASFTGNNDSIIRIGYADCAAGLASNVATDLILFSEVLLRP